MLAIWKRELQSYFYTPVGYVFMGVFLSLSGLYAFSWYDTFEALERKKRMIELCNVTKRYGATEAVTVMACTVLLTLVYVLVVALYGAVYPGELMVGYLGFILQGSAFLALDLYISGCASNQVTAAVAAFGVNLALWLMDLLAGGVTQAWLQDALSFFSLYQRYNPFLMGQLSFASIGFDLAFIAAFLALTVHSLDSRRYRGV